MVQVEVDVQSWGLEKAGFLPTLAENRGAAWRVVFDVDDDYSEVRILAIDEHDWKRPFRIDPFSASRI